MSTSIPMDVNMMTQLWMGLFAVVIVLFNIFIWTVEIWKSRRPPVMVSVDKSEDHLVPVQFQDGSVAMIDPNNPDEVAVVAALYQEGQQAQQSAPQDAFYSPNAGGMPSKDISEYDWSKEDYETKTAGPIGEKTYD